MSIILQAQLRLRVYITHDYKRQIKMRVNYNQPYMHKCSNTIMQSRGKPFRRIADFAVFVEIFIWHGYGCFLGGTGQWEIFPQLKIVKSSLGSNV